MILPYHVYSQTALTSHGMPTHTVFVGRGMLDCAIDRAIVCAKRLAVAEQQATSERHVVTCDGLTIFAWGHDPSGDS